jgi:hypothetical protein
MEQDVFQIPEVSPAPTGKSPRTFGEIPPLWLRIFQMTETWFAEEAPRASDSNTLLSLLVMGGISIVLSIVSSVINSGFQALVMPEFREFAAIGLGSSIMGAVCGGICGGLIGAFVGFYINNGLIYLCTQIFGGRGSFSTQTYLISLFTVPITVIAQVVAIVFSLIMLPFYQIPVGAIIVGIIGLGVGLLISVYMIILYVRALKVTHGLSTLTAVIATLLPSIIIIGIFGCLFVVGLALLGPQIAEIFEEIMWELQQYQ